MEGLMARWLLKTIYAFTNTVGGKLDIGIADTGTVTGVADSKSLVEKNSFKDR